MQLAGDSVRRHYDLHALSLAAQPLLCSAITGLEQVGGGGNNRLYRIRAADGACYALKTYLAEARDCRDRIGAECDGLNFAWAHGLRQVPHVVGADRDAGLALFEWIDGTQIAEPRDGDIDDALGLLGDLHAISKLPEARTLALASEACLSAAELSRQIAGRRARLMATADPRLMNCFDAGFYVRLDVIRLVDQTKLSRFGQQSAKQFCLLNAAHADNRAARVALGFDNTCHQLSVIIALLF